jgi:hypothetical protein
MPRLLQICNVGRIVGGTAACAWTVTRALPDFEHHVLFLSPPDRETVEAFAPVAVSHSPMITPVDIAAIDPDFILLHNTSSRRILESLPAPTILYLHSAISEPAQANVVVCCSQWLARRLALPVDHVLWQAVPKSAPLGSPRVAADREQMAVGRLCTPQARKWPRSIVPFYAQLAARCPNVNWEFVGCLWELQPALTAACQGRCRFHPAGWQQRGLLTKWDVLLYSNPALPESFGRTVAESMRSGCIPVVDRLGGFIEQIPDDCGFLCSSCDEFAAALGRLSDVDFRCAISARAKRHANHWFSETQFARNLRMWLKRAGRG